MNLEDLKTNSSQEEEQLDKDMLTRMLGVNKNPVLRGIKIQLTLESIVWTTFLAVYYNFFDGHAKPVLWNILLVLAVGLLLVHNMLGYSVTNNPINGINILESLSNYLQRIRRYSYLSISTRILALVVFFGFFLSGLESFEERHYWSIMAVVFLVAFQVFVLNRIWSNRINTVAKKYQQLI